MFGLSTLWTALLTFPLMAAVQGMSARIGMVTMQGLTGTLKSHYPKYVLYGMILFSFPAVVMNIGADIQSMGAVAHLLFPAIPTFLFCIVFTGVLLLVIIQYLPPADGGAAEMDVHRALVPARFQHLVHGLEGGGEAYIRTGGSAG